jgi:hypothetical protein
MALPFALVTLARQLGTLPPDAPVTLWWPTQGLPRWIPPTSLPDESGEAWTYPDVATAFAVVWYCCVMDGPRGARRYDAHPVR